MNAPKTYWDEARWPWWSAAAVVGTDLAACGWFFKLNNSGVVGRSLFDAFFGAWGIVPRLLFVGVLVAFVVGRGGRRGLGLVADQLARRATHFAVLAGVLASITLLLTAAAVIVVRWAGHPEAIQPPVYRDGDTTGWIVIFVLGLPAMEELMYRSVVHGTMRRWMGPWGAIVCGGLLFGLVHYFYGIGLAWVWGYAIAGMMLAWMYERTGSVLFSWLLHALANLSAALVSTRTGLFESMRGG